MKKTLLFTALTLLASGSLFAQTYNESDKEGLRKILRQEAPDKSISNLAINSLSPSDTTDWQTSENWISKVKGGMQLEWSNTTPKRLTAINIVNGVENSNFDLSFFSQLKSLSTGEQTLLTKKRNASDQPKLWKYTLNEINPSIEEINLSNGMFDVSTLKNYPNLKIFEAYYYASFSDGENIENNRFSVVLDFSHNPLLELVYLNTSSGSGVILSENKNLKSLSIHDTSFYKSLQLEENTNLEELTLVYLTDLVSLDLSHNIKLKKLSLGGLMHLQELKLGDMNLETLSLSQTSHIIKHQNLDLTQMTNLQHLNITSNFAWSPISIDISTCEKIKTIDTKDAHLLTKIILPKNTPNLEYLNLSNSKFTLSNLPLVSAKRSYIYNPQQTIRQTILASEGIIDLSSQRLIDGKISTFEWSLDGTTTIDSEGKFMINGDMIGKTITCTITNKRFPDLESKYEIRVVLEIADPYKYNSSDILGLKNILRQQGFAYNKDGSKYLTSNLELFGLTVADTLNWDNQMAWVEKINNSTNSLKNEIIWSYSAFFDINSITSIKINTAVENSHFDMSSFEDLEEFRCNIIGILSTDPLDGISATLDIRKNKYLRILDTKGIEYKESSLFDEDNIQNPHYNYLEYIKLASPARGGTIFFSHDIFGYFPALKVFKAQSGVYFGETNTLDLSSNRALDTLEIYAPYTISDINLSQCRMLRHLSLGGWEDTKLAQLTNLNLAKNTSLRSLILNTELGLDSLDLSHNLQLRKLNINACPNLKNLNLENTNLSELVITNGMECQLATLI